MKDHVDVIGHVRGGRLRSVDNSPHGGSRFCVIYLSRMAKGEVSGEKRAVGLLAMVSAAGPAVSQFGTVTKDSDMSERRRQARVPNGDIAGNGCEGGKWRSRAVQGSILQGVQACVFGSRVAQQVARV